MDPYRGVPTSGSPGACPRCRDLALEPKHTGEVTVAMCHQCRGLWLDGSTMLDLFTASEKELGNLARLDDRSRESRDGEAACPRCSAVMQHEAGAVIDYDSCPRHGLWLDAGELRALVAHAGIDPDPPPAPPDSGDRSDRPAELLAGAADGAVGILGAILEVAGEILGNIDVSRSPAPEGEVEARPIPDPAPAAAPK